MKKVQGNSPLPNGPSDWVEDYADGENCYSNRCSSCRENFFGRKYRVICKLCSKVVQRRVVCAAVLRRDGRMIVGPRHFDPVMRTQIRRHGMVDWHDAEQGFIDQWGNFMTREIAWVVAKEAGQIIREVSTPGTLYSENLY